MSGFLAKEQKKNYTLSSGPNSGTAFPLSTFESN